MKTSVALGGAALAGAALGGAALAGAALGADYDAAMDAFLQTSVVQREFDSRVDNGSVLFWQVSFSRHRLHL